MTILLLKVNLDSQLSHFLLHVNFLLVLHLLFLHGSTAQCLHFFECFDLDFDFERFDFDFDFDFDFEFEDSL